MAISSPVITLIDIEFLPCPNPTCKHQAEVFDRVVVESAAGQLEQYSTLCLLGHGFFHQSRLYQDPDPS
jgi:hypothetical protein